MSLSLSPSHSDNDDDATSSHDITLNLENEHDGISNTHHSSLEAEASHVSGMPHHRKQVQVRMLALIGNFFVSCVYFYQRKYTST